MNKTTRNLLIVFVILAGVYFIFFRGKDKISSDNNLESKLYKADSSKIEKIEVIRTDGSITLEKQSGLWKLTKPVDYAADTSSVYPLLGDLQNLTIESVTSTNPQNFGTYFDTTNNSRVNVFQEGKMVGTFVLGKSSQAYNTAYVKKADENKVYLVSKVNVFNFNKPLKDYRSKYVLSINSLQIKKFEFKSTDSNKVDFAMAKDSLGQWKIGADTVTKTTTDGFVNLFANFNTDGFVDSAVTFTTPPTFTLIVYADGIQPTVFNFYKQDSSPAEFFLQISNQKQLFRVPEGYSGTYMKKKKDFIPETPKK